MDTPRRSHNYQPECMGIARTQVSSSVSHWHLWHAAKMEQGRTAKCTGREGNTATQNDGHQASSLPPQPSPSAPPAT
jgi:hypothetical protein